MKLLSYIETYKQAKIMEIKTTKIDTGGHGYLSVSKKDFLLTGLKPEQISGYSGHNLSRVYLEEDCDASLFFDTAKKKGLKVTVKDGYNIKFNCSHNFKPELFNYIPKNGDILNDEYEITGKNKKHLFVTTLTGKNYKISLSNLFYYIQTVKSNS